MKNIILFVFLSHSAMIFAETKWTGSINADGAIEWHEETACEKILRERIDAIKRDPGSDGRVAINSIMPECMKLGSKLISSRRLK